MAPSPRPSWLVRCATIVLPIVVVLRLLLLVAEYGGRHHSQPPQELAWPPVAGEEISFHDNNDGIHAWAARRDHGAIPAVLIERNGEKMPAESGCMLNPKAMADGVGGTLTLASADKDGAWTASWDGAATMPSLEESGLDQGGTPAKQAMETALLQATDCGTTARIQLTRGALHRLVNILNNQPAPLPGTDPEPRLRTLNMRVQQPAP